MTLHVRPLTDEEQRVITQMSRSSTEEARLVERARILICANEGMHAPHIARHLARGLTMVRKWIKRFNEHGLEGVLDAPRSGAPVEYEAEVRAQIIATALTAPKDLELPFASWTYERLHAYLREHHGIKMSKTRIFEILQEEGLRWYKQEGWFGERVDPQFAQKRGRSNG